ncbi:MAG: peptidase domain protein [Bacteroidetes bacterium]|jgi:predicted metalloprotease with PDZ domain|nr:peptidase domain protein [Bacteroidota bacterium]
MRKELLTFLLVIIISTFSFAESGYRFFLDLNKCTEDKLSVELKTPQIKTSEITYRLPKMVPGTYEIYDFGRFVSEFKAFDKDSNELIVEHVDKNSWKILDAAKLYSLSYKVEDTWDTNIKEKFVFEPGGSNFEEGKNFILNTHCLFGFFDEMLRLPYQINLTHPSSFYGTCSLTDVVYKDNTDIYSVPDYYSLQDAPMMYNVPDTTILNVGGAQIIISLYSQKKVSSSAFIANKIKEILIAQQKYLGGTLPIKKYAYLIYLATEQGGSGASGALEHSYSSLYFLPEMPEDQLAQTITDVSAHEFFHIVTPLNIHAEQIGNFDFNNPQMSKHLWLYEGTTEYAAGLVQVKYGTMSADNYLRLIEEKIMGAGAYNDSLPFTVMSAECLTKYRDQYNNVYQKGALIGLCLDLKLRHLSGGKYGLQELMKDLSRTYGKERSFKDDELFDQIVKLTYPEIADFFKRYVEGSEPLPIEETLRLAGIGFSAQPKEKELTLGGVSIGLNPATNRLIIVNTPMMDDFGKAMGYQEYDEIVKFNGKKLTLENAQVVITNFMMHVKEGDVLKVVVLRKKSEDSKPKKVRLKSKIFPVIPSKRSNLVLFSDATADQLKVRSAWIGNHN